MPYPAEGDVLKHRIVPRCFVVGGHVRQHPSAPVLGAQLLSLILYALVDDTLHGRVLFGAAALVVVPLAVWVVSRRPAANRVAWARALPAIGWSTAAIVLDRTELVTWSATLESTLYFSAAGGLIAYMLRDHIMATDEVYASGATFTLVAWGSAYA